MVDQKTLIVIARQTAISNSLRPDLVCAVVEQESGWYPFAVRYEPAFFTRYIHPEHPDTPTTEDMNRAQSFGLMQIMGETARELGFAGKYLTELCDPVTGLEFGCRKLSRCFKNANGSIHQALLAYNGGGNPNYPDRVMSRMAKYQDARTVAKA